MFILLACGSVGGVICFAIFFGFFSGAYVSLLPSVTASFARSVGEIGVRMGVSFAVVGVAALLGTPISGWLIGNGPVRLLVASLVPPSLLVGLTRRNRSFTGGRLRRSPASSRSPASRSCALRESCTRGQRGRRRCESLECIATARSRTRPARRVLASRDDPLAFPWLSRLSPRRQRQRWLVRCGRGRSMLSGYPSSPSTSSRLWPSVRPRPLLPSDHSLTLR